VASVTSLTGLVRRFRRVRRERLICSYPKSGQTWLRFMLARLLVRHYGIDLDLDLTNVFWVIADDEKEPSRGWPVFRYARTVPTIGATHLPYDPKAHQGCAITFIVRDPRDVLVSYWLHRSHQMHRFDGELGAFVRDPRYGVAGLLAYLEMWSPVLDRPSCLVVTYEEMHEDTGGTLRRVAAHFDVPATDAELEDAVEAGRFSRMRAKELRSGVAGHVYDRSREEALRVRRGRVRGYAEYLDPADELLIRRSVEAASPGVRRLIARTGYALGGADP
jgi:alcohol sulfotransferase